MDDDKLLFIDDTLPSEESSPKQASWRILIVDDDHDVHDATIFTLQDTMILDKPLRFLHAYSAEEGINTLKSNPDIALVLLDAVMETEEAGLSAVQVIREELGMEHVRIILRTGQPGQVPELDTITKYDINDYKTKSELNRTKLITTIISALRSWQQLQRIENSRKGLEKIVVASNQFIAEQGLQDFAEGVIIQMAGLFGLEPEGIVCAAGCSDGCTPLASDYQVIAAAGQYRNLINHTVLEIDNPEIVEGISEALKLKHNLFGKRSLTIYFSEPSGRDYATWLSLPRLLDDIDAHLLEIFCTNLSLCASNIELVNRLKRQAWEDSVLKIPNMAALLERIRLQISDELTRDEILVILDIEGFHRINDMLGHEYGDKILCALVEQVREILGKKVFIARIAADVFAILGMESEFNPNVLRSLSSMRIMSPNGERDLSISIGIARIDPEEKDATSPLRNGFVALKRAKLEGSGQVVRYSSKIGEETRAHIKLLDQLGAAISDQNLFLMYQPQVKVKDRRVFSFEALLRWKNDEGRFIPPDRFIPLAEQSGLIIPLGDYVLRTALLALKTIHEEGFPDLRMAVNVSVMQLRRKDYLATLDSAIADIGVDPTLLELEITESISVIGIEDTLKLLKAIRERGISIAVDDFGTGYSSLSSIDRWPVNRLKIDRSFISNMEKKEDGARLVDLVIPLGNRLSMDVLAEGVETEEQMARLNDLGCHEAQGYLISRPIPLNELLDWLRNSGDSWIVRNENASI